MKPQTTKKLFAFIITILFTISFLQAQYCSGKKVGMCKTTGLPECRCVNQSQVQKYLTNGWEIATRGGCPCSFAQTSNKILKRRNQNKLLVNASDNPSTSSKKLNRR